MQMACLASLHFCCSAQSVDRTVSYDAGHLSRSASAARAWARSIKSNARDMEHAVVLLPSDDGLRRLAAENAAYDAALFGPTAVRSFSVYLDTFHNRAFLCINDSTYSATSTTSCCHAFHSVLIKLRFSILCSLTMSPSCVETCASISDGPVRFVDLEESYIAPRCRCLWRAARAARNMGSDIALRAWASFVPLGVPPIVLWCIRPETGELDADALVSFPAHVRKHLLQSITSCSEPELMRIVQLCGRDHAHRTIDSCATELRYVHTPVHAAFRETDRPSASSPLVSVLFCLVLAASFLVVVAWVGWRWGGRRETGTVLPALPPPLRR